MDGNAAPHTSKCDSIWAVIITRGKCCIPGDSAPELWLSREALDLPATQGPYNSQSTICRFESLTLSHNNMIALKPILQAWLEEAEGAQREKMNKPELFNGGEKKRKRTSIAAPEKRSLEAYFAVQPRPSSEKIAAIAEKLDLKKNVVRVWFCNQRQKQKRMKFSATY
ncbi:POU domain, class 4, transcription factor 1 [Puma concolor]|uniref:POU domain protein n=1 Tax=Puma concolor TaxID=9696 RepID=A0A6P6HVA6_PUMCO|nr:POU domain, class 4, transcription factor 1 [Puma concolor]